MDDTSHTWDGWLPCEYFLWRMGIREMNHEQIMATLREPDRLLPADEGRLIYQKLFGKKLLRIVTEGNILVTAYETSQVKRYTEER